MQLMKLKSQLLSKNRQDDLERESLLNSANHFNNTEHLLKLSDLCSFLDQTFDKVVTGKKLQPLGRSIILMKIKVFISILTLSTLFNGIFRILLQSKETLFQWKQFAAVARSSRLLNHFFFFGDRSAACVNQCNLIDINLYQIISQSLT